MSTGDSLWQGIGSDGTLLHHLATHLRDTVQTDEAAREWLHRPTRYPGGLAPADALRVAKIERLGAQRNRVAPPHDRNRALP